MEVQVYAEARTDVRRRLALCVAFPTPAKAELFGVA